jgi:hypothetical protein
MKYENKVAIGGWIAVAVVLVLLVFTIAFVPTPVPPSPDTLPREAMLVNTANVIDITQEGNYTRVWYSMKSKWLFVEPPAYFQGPTKIVTATRVVGG